MKEPELHAVETGPGYNSWPMIVSAGSRLVCIYSCGKAHEIYEPFRKVCVRHSDDGGLHWSGSSVLSDSPGCGDVPAGKGRGEDGSLLFWVRCTGNSDFRHELYRSADGISFEKIALFRGDPVPMQITDIFQVPGVGLMSLWFSGEYRDDARHNSWGTLVSSDNGRSWHQQTAEKDLDRSQWPTEPSAVWLGGGRILAVARTESRGSVRCQHQLQSEDSGRTWKRMPSNICDVLESTPSLLYAPLTKTVSCCYYQRGAGVLKRRTVSAEAVWDHPGNWPEPEILCHGSTDGPHHAGNVSVCRREGGAAAAFYSGTAVQTDILMLTFPE